MESCVSLATIGDGLAVTVIVAAEPAASVKDEVVEEKYSLLESPVLTLPVTSNFPEDAPVVSTIILYASLVYSSEPGFDDPYPYP